MTHPKPSAKTLGGHPLGLYQLLYLELWERFAYYGTRSLLVFYAIKQLDFNDHSAYGLYGALTALVYLGPFLGGLVTDRWLGAKRGVLWGGGLSGLGILLFCPGQQVFFYIGMSLWILGNSLLKPNLTVLIGEEYDGGSSSRDAGFTLSLVYVGLGAGLAPLCCGFVGEAFGWNYGFLLAAFGVLSGVSLLVLSRLLSLLVIILQFAAVVVCALQVSSTGFNDTVYTLFAVSLALISVPFLLALWKGLAPDKAVDVPQQHVPLPGFVLVLLTLVSALSCLLYVIGTSDKDNQFRWLYWLLALAPVLWFVYQIRVRENLERKKLRLALIFMLFHGCALGFQTLAEFEVAKASGEKILHGFMGVVSALPLLALIPFVLWTLMAKLAAEPSPGVKFAFSFLALGLGFLAFSMAKSPSTWGLIPLQWFFAGGVLCHTGTLILVPTARSAMTTLCPKDGKSTMAGAWFSGSTIGVFLGGELAVVQPNPGSSHLVAAGVGALVLACLCWALKGGFGNKPSPNPTTEL